jgi:hypothetical protein
LLEQTQIDFSRPLAVENLERHWNRSPKFQASSTREAPSFKLQIRLLSAKVLMLGI